MAAPKGNDDDVKTDRDWNAHLMCKLSRMLTRNDFRDLKQVFLMTDRVARRDIEETSDFIPFWDMLERLDHISVGKYDVLIQHLEMLQLNNCIRVIREHTEKIEEYRLLQTREVSKPREPTRIQVRYVAPPSAEVNKGDKDGKTQLMQAAGANDVARVRRLIEEGADLNLKGGENGRTSLIVASWFGHKDVVAELIKADADVNIKDVLGKTALIIASMNGHKEVAAELIKAGADVNIKDIKGGWTALIWASQKGHKEVLTELIKAGAEVNIKNKDGWTALIYASWEGHKEVVAELIKAGADVNIKNKVFVKTDAQHRDLLVRKKMLSSQETVTDEQQDGETALDWAKKWRYIEIAKMLKSATTRR